MYWAYKPVRPIMINCEICRGRWFQYHASRLANQPPGHPNRFGCLGALVARTNDADWRKLKLRPKAFYRDWRANRPAIQTGLDAWAHWSEPTTPTGACSNCVQRRLIVVVELWPKLSSSYGRVVAALWLSCGRTVVEKHCASSTANKIRKQILQAHPRRCRKNQKNLSKKRIVFIEKH